MVWMFLVPAVVALAVFMHFANLGKERLKKEQSEISKNNYNNALHYLASNPAAPEARIACLEAGRIHYSFGIPDTQVVRGAGVVVKSTDNSANRESRIQSDIEARIGHLKVGA